MYKVWGEIEHETRGGEYERIGEPVQLAAFERRREAVAFLNRLSGDGFTVDGKPSRPFGVLVIEGDVEPQDLRWFETDERRVAWARRWFKAHGEQGGIFRIGYMADGSVTVGVFMGSELEGD